MFSRPGELLVEHCREVAERSDEPSGWIHDIGKATEWFQRYVDENIEESRIDRSLRTHGRIGAYVAYYCARQRGLDPKTAYVDTISIARHHGNVPNAINYIRNHLPGTDRWIWIAKNELDQLDLEIEAPTDHNTKALAQARNIDALDGRRTVADYLIGEASDDAGSWPNFLDQFQSGDLQEEMRAATMKHKLSSSLDPEAFADGGNWYEDLITTYSRIQLADGTAAGNIPEKALRAAPFPSTAIEEHVHGVANEATTDGVTGALNAIRSNVQTEVVDRLQNGVADDLQGGGVARLSLPTGYAKTLTSGLFAEHLLNRTVNSDSDRRVIYALPFTVVADQTAEEFEDALGVDPMMLSIDHHRAETPTDRIADEQEVTTRGANTILSAWRPRMIITTTVQLFESIVGPYRSQSTKLPALEHSIIILDEPQAIPIGWRPLIARAIETLVEEYNAVVLLMTATQPFLLKGTGLNVTELISNNRLTEIERTACHDAGIDEIPNRTVFEFDESVMSRKKNDETNALSYDDAAKRIISEFTADPAPSIAICNSVESTRALTDQIELTLPHNTGFQSVCVGKEYDALINSESNQSSLDVVSPEDLIDALEDKADAESTAIPVFHFTRRLPGAKLFVMIEAAKKLSERDNPFPHIVVSTQLVEAGVDISYRRLYRDFAPLDSIIQAAGRCNRSYEWGINAGEVLIWMLGSPNETAKLPSEAVYNTRHGSTSISLNTLRRSWAALEPILDRQVIREADLREAVTTYHDTLSEDLSDITVEDDRLLQAYDRGQGAYLRQASLIDDNRFEVDIVVCATKGDRQLVNDLREYTAAEKWEEAACIQRQINRWSVSVPIYSFESSKWGVVSDLDQLLPESDSDDRVVGTTSGLVDARDGVKINRSPSTPGG